MQGIKKYYNLIALFFLASLFFLNLNLKKVYADNNCDNLTGDAHDQCVSLEKKAKLYSAIIKLKNKQQDALSQQLNSINNEQQVTLTQLQTTQNQVQTLTQQIDDLEKSIKDKENLIDLQKKMLTEFMQSYYDYDQQGVLPVVLADKNFSDIFSQTDHLEQTSSKVSTILEEILSNKKILSSNQDDLKQKKIESDNAKNDLLNKKNDLQSSEDQKTNLLTQTQGEEIKYKQLLAHIEAQKSQLFDFSAASNIDEISASVSNYPAPNSHLASTNWYFSQTDSRWGGNKIGNSNSLMKDWGCAVASISMVFRKMGSNIDPGKMAKQKIFSGDLINWPNSWDPGISLISSVSHGNYSKSTIDNQISKGNPVIIHINKTNGKGGHYVVITGKDNKDYIVHDPYFGANLYLGTSRSLVGKLGANSGTSLDQMIIYN